MKSTLRLSLCLAGASLILLSSCVVPVDYYDGPYVGNALPARYYGPSYYYGGMYYIGGRYEPGRFFDHGRYYDHRYCYKGRYLYGGRYDHYHRH